MQATVRALFAVTFLLLEGALACQIHWNGRNLLADDKVLFNYAKSGDDWPDVQCKFGKEQSPINVVLTDTREFEDKSLLVQIETFGKGKNVRTFTTGQGLQVEWDWVEDPVIRIPVVDGSHYGALGIYDPNSTVTYARAWPIQFHFHTPSENTIDGRFFPLEAHIVCRIPPEEAPSCADKGDLGCLVVFGVHYEFHLQRNMFFDMIFGSAPRTIGEEFASFIDKDYVLNLDLLTPSNKDYIMWKGSLTTPPCAEQVLWFLFMENESIAVEELLSLQNHMRDVKTACLEDAFEEKSIMGLKSGIEECMFYGDRTNNRPIQPLNRRSVKKHLAPSS